MKQLRQREVHLTGDIDNTHTVCISAHLLLPLYTKSVSLSGVNRCCSSICKRKGEHAHFWHHLGAKIIHPSLQELGIMASFVNSYCALILATIKDCLSVNSKRCPIKNQSGVSTMCLASDAASISCFLSASVTWCHCLRDSPGPCAESRLNFLGMVGVFTVSKNTSWYHNMGVCGGKRGWQQNFRFSNGCRTDIPY